MDFVSPVRTAILARNASLRPPVSSRRYAELNFREAPLVEAAVESGTTFICPVIANLSAAGLWPDRVLAQYTSTKTLDI